jgi:acyl-CoA dehydrogenase
MTIDREPGDLLTWVQFHGASGLESGHLVELLYREIRATRIFEGASEIQRDIIARDLFAGTPIGRPQADGVQRARAVSP